MREDEDVSGYKPKELTGVYGRHITYVWLFGIALGLLLGWVIWG